MKRTLSLVLALVMVLGSFSAVFAAEEEVVNEAAEILYDLGILREYRLDDQLERRDAVILLARLLGEEEEAKEFEAEGYPTWEDNTDPFYDGYLAWAEVNGYFEGVAEGKFSPRTHLTAQDFSLVLLRALGYDVKGHDAWKKALETAEEAGLLVDLEVEEKDVVSRGLMAVLVLNTLKAEVVDEGVTLAEKLGYELPEEVPAELEIVSVTADNLKEVEVVFNQEVDEETVVNANFTIKNIETEVVLKEDGKTAVVTVSPELKNQKEYTLVVEKVKAVTGVEIEKTEVEFKAFDATLPEVVGLEVTGPRHLTLTFSEPLNEKENVKGKVTIKQGKASLGNKVEVKGNKVHVTAYSNFVEGKEYEVTVENFVDYAGYKNVIEVLTFTYEKDETPPVATIEKVEQEYVIVSFNKPVKGLQKENFYHTFTAWDAEELKDMNGEDVTKSSSVDKVKVIFYKDGKGKAIPAGSTVFGILGKDIKDNWGNALGNVEYTISATADRTAPEVKEITVESEKSIKVVFTKEVKALTRDNVEILDENGDKISGLYVYAPKKVDNKADQYLIEFNKALAGKIITVNIKDVKDTTLYENVLSLHTELVEITDKTKPVVEKVYFDLETDKALYVVFSESVDPETALKASNYAIVYPEKDNKDAEVVILTEEPSFDVNDTRVKLPLTDKQANKLATAVDVEGDHNVKLQVINVKDLAGNVITPVLNKISGEVAKTAKLEFESAKLVDKTTLEIEFKDLLSGITQESVKVAVYKDGGKSINDDFKFGIDVVNNGTTKLIITATDNYEFGTDLTKLESVKIIGKGIENSFGVEVKEDLTIYAKDFEDEARPEVEEVKLADDRETVTITFSEVMDEATFSKLSFEVEGKKLADTEEPLTWDDEGKVLTLKLNEALESEEELRVIYRQNVADKSGNLLNYELGEVFVETVEEK